MKEEIIQLPQQQDGGSCTPTIATRSMKLYSNHNNTEDENIQLPLKNTEEEIIQLHVP